MKKIIVVLLNTMLISSSTFGMMQTLKQNKYKIGGIVATAGLGYAVYKNQEACKDFVSNCWTALGTLNKNVTQETVSLSTCYKEQGVKAAGKLLLQSRAIPASIGLGAGIFTSLSVSGISFGIYAKECWTAYKQRKEKELFEKQERERCADVENVLFSGGHEDFDFIKAYYDWAGTGSVVVSLYPKILENSESYGVEVLKKNYSTKGVAQSQEFDRSGNNDLMVRKFSAINDVDKIGIFKNTCPLYTVQETDNLQHVTLTTIPGAENSNIKYRLAYVKKDINTRVYIDDCGEATEGNSLVLYDQSEELIIAKPIVQIVFYQVYVATQSKLFVLCDDEIQIFRRNIAKQFNEQSAPKWVKEKSIAIDSQNKPLAMEFTRSGILVFYENKIMYADFDRDTKATILHENISVLPETVIVLGESIIAADKQGNLVFLTQKLDQDKKGYVAKHILLKDRAGKQPIKQCQLVTGNKFSAVIALLDDNSIVMINTPIYWREGIIFEFPEYHANHA